MHKETSEQTRIPAADQNNYPEKEHADDNEEEEYDYDEEEWDDDDGDDHNDDDDIHFIWFELISIAWTISVIINMLWWVRCTQAIICMESWSHDVPDVPRPVQWGTATYEQEYKVSNKIWETL